MAVQHTWTARTLGCTWHRHAIAKPQVKVTLSTEQTQSSGPDQVCSQKFSFQLAATEPAPSKHALSIRTY